MRALAIAAALMLAGCATATTGDGPKPAVNGPAVSITFEVTSWGYVQERWTISANGEAVLERPPAGAQFGTPVRAESFTVTPADFESVRAALEPAERVIATGLDCDLGVTDAPSGDVIWRRADGAEQRVHFYTGCQRTDQLDAFFERTRAADDAFH